MKISPRNVFLFDGIGAMASLTFHLIIAFCESIFGMPIQAVLALAIFPVLLMPFSFFHFFRFPQDWKPILKIIISSNLIFCIVSIGVVAYYFDLLTSLGLIYFIGEVIVVLTLVALVELPTLKSSAIGHNNS